MEKANVLGFGRAGATAILNKNIVRTKNLDSGNESCYRAEDFQFIEPEIISNLGLTFCFFFHLKITQIFDVSQRQESNMIDFQMYYFTF